MEATASLYQQQSLCWCRRYSHFWGGEALFLRYGYADNVCIISALASERSTIAPISSLRFWLAHAHTHTHTQTHCVCLFVSFSSFRPSSSFFLSPKQTHALSMTTKRQRCACVCRQLVFLVAFLSCFLRLLSFFYSSISLLLPSRKRHTQT